MSVYSRPKVLIPKSGHEKWAVVACDQFTSEPNYWAELEREVGDAPSALKIIFPEAYLGGEDEKRIESINREMLSYVKDKDFFKEVDSFILVERTVGNATRLGLMVAVDLDSYDYVPGSNVPVKATEGTILERIPPRVKIRENAPLELTHIMLLSDDRDKILNERLYENRDRYEVLYDFELSKGGGHLRGYRVDDEDIIEEAVRTFSLSDRKRKLYGRDTEMVFAVGDGNHSLLTAKTCWEKLKRTLSAEEILNHPARYALVELVNLYDDGLVLEPIHRVIFNPSEKFKAELKALEGESTLRTTEGNISVPASSIEAIKTVQALIERAEKEGTIRKVDYVHGDDSLSEIVKASESAIGIFMPDIKKEELFPYVLNNGVLPKKAFSMGSAHEKRYYMEARVIKGDIDA